jgi:hypothetical protein
LTPGWGTGGEKAEFDSPAAAGGVRGTPIGGAAIGGAPIGGAPMPPAIGATPTIVPFSLLGIAPAPGGAADAAGRGGPPGAAGAAGEPAAGCGVPGTPVGTTG